jgi:MraZ protein
MAFRGSYDYQLDDRNRVALPPRYRDAFRDGAVLTPGVDGCVEVYTPEAYEQQAEDFAALSSQSRMGRQARRAFAGMAFDVPRDTQGRILIPQKLLAHAGLKKADVRRRRPDTSEIGTRPPGTRQEATSWKPGPTCTATTADNGRRG